MPMVMNVHLIFLHFAKPYSFTISNVIKQIPKGACNIALTQM